MQRGRKRASGVWVAVLVVGLAGGRGVAEAPAGAMAAFQSYVGQVEGRLERERNGDLLAGMDAGQMGRVRGGEMVVEQASSGKETELPGAMLHHWRGTAFIRGGTEAGWERVMRDYGAYPRVYAPEVLGAKVVGGEGDRVQVWMRVRQEHVLKVVLDATYAVSFGRAGRRGWSASRSMGIQEMAGVGTERERALTGGEEHGFLWRLNTYWRCEERDGGVYVRVETVSLSRAIPRGLGWAVGPFVESVPRESVEFTLRRTVSALER